MNCGEHIFPGSAGAGDLPASVMYGYTKIASGVPHKYSLTRYMSDRFYLPIPLGSQDLNKIDKEYDIQGTVVWAAGRYANL